MFSRSVLRFHLRMECGRSEGFLLVVKLSFVEKGYVVFFFLLYLFGTLALLCSLFLSFLPHCPIVRLKSYNERKESKEDIKIFFSCCWMRDVDSRSFSRFGSSAFGTRSSQCDAFRYRTMVYAID